MRVRTKVLVLCAALASGVGAGPACGGGGRGGPVSQDFADVALPLGWVSEPESDSPVRFRWWLAANGTKLEAVDHFANRMLIKATTTPLWQPVAASVRPCLVTPTISLFERQNGCDLVFLFVNATAEWSGLGKITVAGVRFDEQITGHDFRFDGKPITLNADNTGIGVSGWHYPGGTYSPVNVIEDGDYKVGISLIYPVLTYEHQVRIRCKPQFPAGEPAWFTEFILNSEDEARYHADGDLAPGESRLYVVSVRVATDKARWQETLEPYRAYFESKHGGVDYQRNPTPVQFTSLATDSNQSPDNTYGFTEGDSLRPDHNGFGPWMDRFVERGQYGFSRVMISKPTGLFLQNRQNNIPPLFASHWLEGDEYGHAMGDAVEQFNRVPQSGLKLGLWWGRAGQVMPDGWDTSGIERLDPDNPEHVALAFRELDIAYAAGARLFGLDAFREIPAWDAVNWIQKMKQRAPGARFVTEPVCGDVLHNRAPAFQVATRPTVEAALRVETRHFLADFLNPGHELWGYIRDDRLADYIGHEPTVEDWIAEAERVAALGYVPCVSELFHITPGMTAVESWVEDRSIGARSAQGAATARAP